MAVKRLFLYSLTLLLLLLTTQTQCIVLSTITFNTSAPCVVASGVCSFADPTIWNDGILPGLSDEVVIQSYISVCIVLDGVTTAINTLTINGNVAFNMSDSVLTVTNGITWYGPAVVSLQNTSCFAQSISGQDMYLNESHVKVKTSILYSAQINESIFSSTRANVTTLQVSGETSNLAGTFTIGSLYSYGDVSFYNLNILHYALFEDNADLDITYFATLTKSATVVISNCQSTINQASLSLFTNMSFIGELVTTHTITTLSCTTSCSSSCFLILENVNISLGGAFYATPVVGENVVINLLYARGSTTLCGMIQLDEAPVTINTNTQFSFYATTTFSGTVNAIGYYGIWLVNTLVNIEPECRISGSGILKVDGDYGFGVLNCEGKIDIATVQVTSTNITAEALSCGTLQVQPGIFTTRVAPIIFGNIEMENGDFSVLNTIVTVFGNIELQDGKMETVGFSSMPVGALISVHGEVQISGVVLSVNVGEFEGKLLLMQATEEIKASFLSVSDMYATEHKIDAEVEEEKIYIITHEEGDIEWLQNNLVYFIVFASVVGVLAIFMGFCVRRVSRVKDLPDPGTYIPQYLSSITFSRLGCYEVFSFFVIYIFVWIGILEGAVLTLALGILIPLGFVFGLIEHKFARLWGVIVLFVQVGGLLDIFADLLLMAKVSAYFFIHDVLKSDQKSSWDYLEGQELQMWAARLIMTIFSAFLAVQLMFTLRSKDGLGKLLDKLSGKKLFAGTTDSPSMRGSGCAIFFQLIFCVIFWKVLMLGIRIYLLCVVVRSLVTKGKLTQRSQYKIQWMECILYFDLMWSGLPLGVLTLIEMFYFSEDFQLGREQAFELMKIGALAIDLVGASFLFYFIVCGLIKKIPILHHHDHHEHTEHHHGKTLKEPLLGHLQE